MKLLKKVYYAIKKYKYNYKYKKYRKCSLPYPVYDNKRDSVEWVCYDINDFEVNYELTHSFNEITNCSLCYHYEAKMYGRKYYYYRNEERKYKKIISHCRSFNELIREVYKYPETFNIPNEYLHEYSKQELNYIKHVQSFLLLAGLKDEKIISKERRELQKLIDEIYYKRNKTIIEKIKLMKYFHKDNKLLKKENEDNFKRCQNEKVFEYNKYSYIYIKDNIVISNILRAKKWDRVRIYYSFSSSNLNKKSFLIDKEENYVAILQVVEEKVLKFQELKENMIDYKIEEYKSFKEYKNDLIKKFNELYQCKSEEEFNDNSLICIGTFKVIKVLNTNKK